MESPPGDYRLLCSGVQGPIRYAALAAYLKTRIPFAKLLDLQAGDVLLLDTDEGKPLPIVVQGREKLHGSPTISGGSMALQVEGTIAPPSRTPTSIVH